jgi:hypothetical protein
MGSRSRMAAAHRRVGWAHPDYRSAIGWTRSHLRGSATVAVELPPTPNYELFVGWLADPQTSWVSHCASRVSLTGAHDGESRGGGCFRARAFSIDLVGRTRVRLDAPRDVIVDYLSLARLEAKSVDS